MNLVGWRNRAGLSRDLAVMQDVLSAAGHRVEVHDRRAPPGISRAVRILASGGPPYDLTIHTEKIVPGWMALSHRNTLLPNPEWFASSAAFGMMDAILCKTRWTLDIMSKLHPRCLYTGFTSLDRLLPGVERSGLKPFHLAGRSQCKGTVATVSVWARNPGWPPLTVIAWDTGLATVEKVPENVHVVRGFVDDARLRRIQAECGFHVSPSEAEGFGHSLAEGMSTGALVLTTDAPPMNELVTPERGVLVPWKDSAPMRAGRRFELDVDQLEARVAESLAAPATAVRAFGLAARKWFEENDAEFRRRLVEVVDELLK